MASSSRSVFTERTALDFGGLDRPDVWLSSWAIVISAGLPEGVLRPANSGRYLETGSSTLSLPSSWSIRIATPVTGFVMDAIQNRVSGCIGLRPSMSASPVAPRCRIPSLLATRVTAPATSCASTVACMAAVTAGNSGEPEANAGNAAASERAAARDGGFTGGAGGSGGGPPSATDP